MEESNYFGTERVGKLLRQFAIPCICSLIISCLYNIVDQIFVGNAVLFSFLSGVVIAVVNNVLLVRYGAESIYGAGIPLAAFVVIMKLFQIVLNIATGIAAGAQPIVGYNYGAKKHDRVRELLKLIIKWTAIICILCTVLFEAIPVVFIRMFGADGALSTQFAVSCLRRG